MQLEGDPFDKVRDVILAANGRVQGIGRRFGGRCRPDADGPAVGVIAYSVFWLQVVRDVAVDDWAVDCNALRAINSVR